MSHSIDLVLLSGFLGSGKTSLLVRYLAQYGSDDVAVIVNEAGEIGIDGAIIQHDAGPLQIALLSNGCVCCSVVGELAATIETLVGTRTKLGLPPLRQIVVETSGLSKPGPILLQIASLARHRFHTRLIATWDCVRSRALIGIEEAQAQVAGANSIVLTKTDMVDSAAIAEARQFLQSLNPLARILDSSCLDQPVEMAFMDDGLNHEFVIPDPSIEDTRAHPRTIVWTHQFNGGVDWDSIAEWIDNLAGFCGERLLRVKGIVRLRDGGDPVLVQGVGTTFSEPRRLPVSTEPFLVVIARDVSASEIEGIEPILADLLFDQPESPVAGCVMDARQPTE